MEDFYIGGAALTRPAATLSHRMGEGLGVRGLNFTEIVDLALPAEGVFHNLVFVRRRKTYPMQAYKIMHGLVGTLSTASDTDQGRSGMRPYRS